MHDEKSGKARIKFLFGIAVIVAAVYISFKYLILYVWPFVIGVFIAVIYLVSDLQKFRDNIRQVVFYEEIRMIWKEVRRLINVYFKVQLRIMLINSGLCMLAFAILKNPYAIVLGIIIGIIDALPVFGTGTVLIPWILISFLIRNYRYAVILLIAYIITYFVREIMESKSMGDRLGISPFIMLVIIFTGLLAYGVAGFITGPVSYVIIKALVIRLRCEMGIE